MHALLDLIGIFATARVHAVGAAVASVAHPELERLSR
jgi:hypothetical protein